MYPLLLPASIARPVGTGRPLAAPRLDELYEAGGGGRRSLTDITALRTMVFLKLREQVRPRRPRLPRCVSVRGLPSMILSLRCVYIT